MRIRDEPLLTPSAPSSLGAAQVVAYLMAMKLLLPHKVFLLRGNHETRDVNGWEEHYGERR